MKEIKIMVFLLLLIRMAWIDYKEYIIPRKYLYGACGTRSTIAALELFLYRSEALRWMVQEITTSIVVLCLFFWMRYLSREGIGMGDVKLVGVMSLFLGFPLTVKALFYAVVIAFFQGIFYRLLFRKRKIPFVPALFMGTIVAILL